MPDPTGGVRRLLGLWGSVVATAEQHLPTGQVWASLRRAAEAAGSPLTGVTIQDMNTVRRAANAVVTAGLNLGRARVDQAITGEMIAQAPWRELTAAQAAAPEHFVQYKATLAGPNGPIEQWLMAHFDVTQPLPATVGDLLAQLADQAVMAVGDYEALQGAVLSGVSDVRIMAG